MFRTLLTILVLFTLWLLMSGIYKPLIIGLGVISTILTIIVVHRMNRFSTSGLLILGLKPLACLKYWIWLMFEIAKANWDVTKIILSPEMALNRHMFKVPFTQKTDLGQVIFANSITLTPGTISVEVKRDHFLVHAVSYTPNHTTVLKDMDVRVSAIESQGI